MAKFSGAGRNGPLTTKERIALDEALENAGGGGSLTDPEITGTATITTEGIGGLVIKNSNATQSTQGWEIGQGQPGQYDGYFFISTDHSNTNNAELAIPTQAAPVFGYGVAVKDGTSFASNTSGSLAYYKPYDGTRGSILFRGANASSAKFRIQAYSHVGSVWNGHVLCDMEWDSTDATVTWDANFDITGNIVISGTVDGRDVAADGAKLDGIEAGATANPTPDFIHLTKTSDTQNIGGANGATTKITWDTQDHIDTAGFTHSTGTNPERIAVDVTGRYSINASVSASNAGANRTTWIISYTINGTEEVRGSGRNYSRGAAYNGASMHLNTEADLTAGDYIEIMVTIDDTDQNATCNTQDDRCELIMRKIG